MAARRDFRVKASVTVIVNIDEWVTEYGMDEPDVRTDANETIQRWVDEYLRDQLKHSGFTKTRILE